MGAGLQHITVNTPVSINIRPSQTAGIFLIPLQLFLILNIIAAACKNSIFCILVNSFVLASASVGGVRKQKNLKRTKCGLRKEKNAVVFGMARALEHMGRFIGPLIAM
jgi:hypothetical protein